MTQPIAYRVGKSPEVWDALVKGFGAKDVPALGLGLDLRGPAIIGGLGFGSDRLLREAIAVQHPYLFVDSGYFRTHENGKRVRFRIVPDAYNHHWTFTRAGFPNTMDIGRQRFEALGLTIAPWRDSGREILICTSSAAHAAFFAVEAWAEDMASIIRQHTDRPVVIRNKADPNNVPFAEALKSAHAVVAWSSSVCVEAALAGVPVFGSKWSAAAPVGNVDVAQIETPFRPNWRQEWAWGLAAGQFTVPEIAGGLACLMVAISRHARAAAPAA